MVLSATSSSGKSLLVTALYRTYARRGLRVAPFEVQNMSNNAAVQARQDAAFERLADGVEAALDRPRLDAILGLS